MSGLTGTDGGVIVESLSTLRNLTPTPPEGHARQEIWSGSGVTIKQIALAEGASIPTHTAGRPVVIQVVDGAVRFTIGDEEHRIEAGAIIALSPDREHSLAGLTAARLVLTFLG